MDKTTFKIQGMDCPSEEQMIRMKLDEMSFVKKCIFDLTTRNLTVFHEGNLDKIQKSMDVLNLGSSLMETGRFHDEVVLDTNTDKRLLWSVFVINVSFFIIEVFFGWFSRSMGLIADSVDMLADAFVYALSLYAMSGTIFMKKRIARMSGILQFLLAVAGFAEVIRRVFIPGEMPDFMIMMVVSVFALIANSASLVILNKSKSKEVHIQSSQIFTSNDVIANIGVIVAGVLVLLFHSKIPDLVIGFLVFAFVIRGAFRIYKLSK